MSGFNRSLDDYVDVATRIQRFFEKFPDGSLQSEIVTDDGQRIIIRGLAYRTATDPLPGVGHAEEVRGQGMVNKTSAVENAETSAWGRALAALGFEVKKGVATKQEVQNARAQASEGRVVQPEPAVPPTAQQPHPAPPGKINAAEEAYKAQYRALTKEQKDAFTRLCASEINRTGTSWADVAEKWPGKTLAQILSPADSQRRLTPKTKSAA